MEGRIVKIVSNDFTVLSDGNYYVCKARGKFRNIGVTPIVGDNVTINLNDNIIEDVHERRNSLIRPYVSNIDQVFIVTSTKHPDIDLNLLDKYFNELGIDKHNLPQGVIRRPFDENQLSIVEKYRPPVVSFHFGLPEKRLLDAVKATGAMVLSSATTLKEGLWLQENGADCVIAQGIEAGGHRGVFLENDLASQMGVLPLTELLA